MLSFRSGGVTVADKSLCRVAGNKDEIGNLRCKCLRYALRMQSRKVSSMQITLKIAGVPSEAIGQLHNAVEATKKTGSWITIQESAFKCGHDDYVITLKVEPRQEGKDSQNLHKNDGCEEGYVTYRPLGELLTVLRAADPNLFPEKQTKVPTPKKSKELRNDQLREQIEKLEGELEAAQVSMVGKSPSTSIKLRGGKIILRVGDTYDKEAREGMNDSYFLGVCISELELPEKSDDPFVITLKKAFDLNKELSGLQKEFRGC